MKHIMLLAACCIGGAVLAQETTIEVPQGSPVFPTIGQVDCLEEPGGSYCAATYECADGSSGALWGDMGNHDGRRTTTADADVAIKRGCEITVDGKAAVRWYSGFRPDGRTGALVGATQLPWTLRPIVNVQRTGGSSSGSLLDYALEVTGANLHDYVHEQCGHISEGHFSHTECVADALRDPFGLLEQPATAATRCLFDTLWWDVSNDDECDVGCRIEVALDFRRSLLFNAGHDGPLRSEDDDPGDPARCFDLVQEETRQHGMEWYRPATEDECPRWRDDRGCDWYLRLLE